MRAESLSYPLLMEFKRRVRLPWSWATAALAVLLLSMIMLAAVVDGLSASLTDWEFWRAHLLYSAIIVYILAIYPFMNRLRDKAIEALLPLLPVSYPDIGGLKASLSLTNRRNEWLAALAGFVFWAALSKPWTFVFTWGEAYWLATGAVQFALLGLVIYTGLTESRHFDIVSRQRLNIDIFNTDALAPIAVWSLGYSLAFVGGISISLVFQPLDNILAWQGFVVYGVLVCAAVLVFFISLRSIHKAILAAKTRELDLARRNVASAFRELREQADKDPADSTVKNYSAVAAWGTYEKRVQETPEWPFNAGLLARLMASILVPSAVYLLKFFLGIKM